MGTADHVHPARVCTYIAACATYPTADTAAWTATRRTTRAALTAAHAAAHSATAGWRTTAIAAAAYSAPDPTALAGPAADRWWWAGAVSTCTPNACMGNSISFKNYRIQRTYWSAAAGLPAMCR